MEAVRNFEEGMLKDQHLELLCCDGCVHGPGMSKRGDQFFKRKRISEYVKNKLEHLENSSWEEDIKHFSNIESSTVPSPSKNNNILIFALSFECYRSTSGTSSDSFKTTIEDWYFQWRIPPNPSTDSRTRGRIGNNGFRSYWLDRFVPSGAR